MLPRARTQIESLEDTYNPKQEEAQQISTCDSRTLWKMIRNIVVTVPEDAAHENRRDAPSIVRLGREVDNRYYCSY